MNNLFFNKSGHLTEAAFAFKTKHDDEAINSHLISCESCLTQYKILQDFLVEHEYVSEEVNETFFSPYLKLAAILIFSFGIIYYSFFFSSINSFDRNIILDGFVQSNLRSESVLVSHPINESVYQSIAEIKFLFTRDTLSSYQIEILNNMNRKLYVQNFQEKQLKLDLELNSGRYYWKLIKNNEIIFVGTFKIK